MRTVVRSNAGKTTMFKVAFNSLPRLAAYASTPIAGGVGYLCLSERRDKFTFCQQAKQDPLAPFVICGPSGVGKGYLIQRLNKEFPDKFGFSVSSTTRKPRPGEVDGTHYNFTEFDQMKKEIEDGKFVESAQVHTNLYGTSVAAVQNVKAKNQVAILDIDIQGAKQLKHKFDCATYIFLLPPSMEVLESRLRGRGTETDDKIQVRMTNAAGEIEFSKEPGFFDLVITADNGLTVAWPQIIAVLKQKYPQLNN